MGVLGVGATGYAWARTTPPPPAPVVVVAAPPPAVSLEYDCSTPGVRVTIDGEDAFAPAVAAGDVAGRKYRRGGDRLPWLTVNGPLYVHANGGFLPGDVGTTNLTLFTMRAKGDERGYTLAKDGRSVLTVTSVDDRFVRGHFEADVSKVDDTTRTPAFGTPVVRLRGSFCLPAKPANPNDTGP